VDLLIGVLAALVLGYVNKSAGWFPKYQVAFAPLLACLAAPILARAWCERPRLSAGVGLVVAIASAAITLTTVRDDWAFQGTWAIDARAGAWLGAAVGAAVLVGLPWRATAATACASLVGLAIGWSVGTNLYQQSASYSTGYWYGTSGTAEAAAWVDAHLAPDQTYLALCRPGHHRVLPEHGPRVRQELGRRAAQGAGDVAARRLRGSAVRSRAAGLRLCRDRPFRRLRDL